MKKILIVGLLMVQAGIASAQNSGAEEYPVREMRLPLTEKETETVFYYFNDEWIEGANPGMVATDSIQKMEVKNDQYDNRAVFLTVSPETLAKLKSDVREANKNIWSHNYPICEFPGGNGKLKEWIDSNKRVPEGFQGSERVIVQFLINPDGSVSDAKLYRPGKNEAANAEALRLVNSLPKFRVKYFTPKKIPLKYTLGIRFSEPGAIFIRGEE